MALASSKSKIDSSSVQVVSFDCLGCFIDVDLGLRHALDDEGFLGAVEGAWSDFRKALRDRLDHWRGTTYRHFREILALSLQETLQPRGLKVDDRTALHLADSMREWDIHPDAISALRRLGSQWPLLIITNIDRPPLTRIVDRLGVPFAELITGDSVRMYKPAPDHFRQARERLGDRKDGLLHISRHVDADLRPAHEQGIRTVWLSRGKRSGVPDDVPVESICKDLSDFATKMGC
jgi:2-haloacid dehalogenase